MYQPHSFTWLIFTFVVTLILLLVLVFRPATSGVWASKRLQVGLWILAVVQLLLVAGIRGYNHRRLRQELVGILPTEVAHLVFHRGQTRREIATPAQASQFFAELQSIKAISPHHSSATRRIDFSFDYRGHTYHYQIGEDSDRPDEYWIFLGDRVGASQRAIEIGRLQSSQLGPLLRQLLEEKR